jgi:hypothetical protein
MQHCRRPVTVLAPPFLTTHPQVQFIFAVALVTITLWYQIALGIPPSHKTRRGIPVKFRIHDPALFEEVSLHCVVCADMPSWMMVEEERKLREQISAADKTKHEQDFSCVLDDYKRLIFDDAGQGIPQTPTRSKVLPSFEEYLRSGPFDDSYLDHRNYAVLTRAGGRRIKLKKSTRSKSRRMSISALQQQMKEVSGILQTRFNQIRQGADNAAARSDVHKQKRGVMHATWLEIASFLTHFLYHVLVGGFFDGINSMIQIWAVLVLISGLVRTIQIVDVQAINTAIISLASVAMFLSFMTFYRVNATFGPFIVILKEMTVKDLSKWLFLVVLFLSASGQAMFIILDDPMSFLKVPTCSNPEA